MLKATPMPFHSDREVRGVAEGGRIREFSTLPPDLGCQLAPACLECPLPVCIEDLHLGDRIRYIQGVKDLAILERYQEGTLVLPVFVEQIAEETGMWTESIYRRIRNGKRWQIQLEVANKD